MREWWQWLESDHPRLKKKKQNSKRKHQARERDRKKILQAEPSEEKEW
jgi:hypothetical protein